MGVALIGAGMIAKTHVSALASICTHVRLASIVSRRPERANYLAAYYPGPPPLFTSDLSAVIENSDTVFAIVATPPDVRIELISSLAQAGKHILLEKPVARTFDEALNVVEICEHAGVNLGVVFQHRMWPASKAAAQLLASGRLGQLGHVEISAPLWRAQSYYDELDRGTYARDGGGVMITQAIHTIDLALSLTGPVKSVRAMTATTPLHQMESEDFAIAGLHFSSGAVGSLVASTASYPQGPETITLHCENGSIKLSAAALDITWRDGHCERVGGVSEDTIENGPELAKHEWHQAIIEDFVDSIQQDRTPAVSGRAALESQKLIEAIERSSRSGTIEELKPWLV
ncbi:MAG: Gfo/Idh/MocA family oxidoreductase [Gammaproteobacteria bacterium]|nr:Gfo/Idh/MocA family oxidoreductase [Gammaproteobacteria bacterium]